MKASILGIGTELTTGQILNRNGTWLSQKLKSLGLLTSLHLVTPDDRPLMLESLKYCAQNSDLIFVTGGLGPTSDDFTRDVVADWAGLKMFFHEASWTHIQERLNSRGLMVREFQKQQCYYPEGSEILFNEQGTANAFYFQAHGKEIYVLPGPPKEIESLWQSSIGPRMSALAQTQDGILTKSWDCLGQGESDISFLTEQALKDSGLEIGYRVHLPYVEVKVSYLRSQSDFAKKWISNLDLALKAFTALRDGQDAAELFAQRLAKEDRVLIIDSFTGFHLMNRVFPFAKKLLEDKKLNFLSKKPKSMDSEFSLVLEIEGVDVSHTRVIMTARGQRRTQIFESPYLKLLMKDRERQFFTELALIFWAKSLEDL